MDASKRVAAACERVRIRRAQSVHSMAGNGSRGAWDILLTMRTDRIATLLGQTQLFGGLSDEMLERVAERCVDRRYKKGNIIFRRGDQGDRLYVIAEGSIKVFLNSDDGDEMMLRSLEPTEVLGELALADGGARSASAEALEDTVLVSLDRDTWLDLQEKHAELRQAMLEALVGVVRRLTEHTADLVFLDLQGRVAKVLIQLIEERGTETDEGMVLDLPMTQSDLASMVGGSRQSVNQSLSAFQRRGYLDVRGREVVVLDMAGLRHRAGL